VGDTTTEATDAATVTDALPECPSLDAVIVTGPPFERPVTFPSGETSATDGMFEDHVTGRPVSVHPPLSRNVARNCIGTPTAVVSAAGVTVIVATGQSLPGSNRLEQPQSAVMHANIPV
jgi:hypothetical protein